MFSMLPRRQVTFEIDEGKTERNRPIAERTGPGEMMSLTRISRGTEIAVIMCFWRLRQVPGRGVAVLGGHIENG